MVQCKFLKQIFFNSKSDSGLNNKKKITSMINVIDIFQIITVQQSTIMDYFLFLSPEGWEDAYRLVYKILSMEVWREKKLIVYLQRPCVTLFHFLRFKLKPLTILSNVGSRPSFVSFLYRNRNRPLYIYFFPVLHEGIFIVETISIIWSIF